MNEYIMPPGKYLIGDAATILNDELSTVVKSTEDTTVKFDNQITFLVFDNRADVILATGTVGAEPNNIKVMSRSIGIIPDYMLKDGAHDGAFVVESDNNIHVSWNDSFIRVHYDRRTVFFDTYNVPTLKVM